MSEAPHTTDAPDKSTLAAQIDTKARRKLAARRLGTPDVWFGLGTMGVIGWSVAVPTLLGAGLGSWLDGRYPGTRSWTLALLVAGVVLGCFNAWRWIAKEEQAMHAYTKKETDADI